MKNLPNKSDNSFMLVFLDRATKSIRRLGWRRRRNCSLAIMQYFKDYPNHELVRSFAVRMTGVEPDKWLTKSEAQTALKKLGIRTNSKKLYRLAIKAKLVSPKIMSFTMNKDGESDGIESPEIRDPIAIIDIRFERAARYFVSPFRSEPGHLPDSNLN